jgi:hypothetical protein
MELEKNTSVQMFVVDAKGDKLDWSGLRGKNQLVELYKLRLNWKLKSDMWHFAVILFVIYQSCTGMK